jgi:hypothetical protein
MPCRIIAVCVVAWALSAVGCMHTRYAESSSLLHIHSGDCPCHSHGSTYRERRWSGLWLGQPADVRP